MLRQPRRTTIIVVGGALAVASAGYGLGSQAGDGVAVADNNDSAETRGAPPARAFSGLADKLGVDAGELREALGEFRESRHSSEPTVLPRGPYGATEQDGRRNGRPCGAPFVALRQLDGELARFLADRFDLDAGNVAKALRAARPPLSPHGPGGPPHHPPPL
jgi:hypothetical protein